MASLQWQYAAEHRREYDVPLQAVIRGRLWARRLTTLRVEALVGSVLI
jgi:hypothetical protein